MVMESQHIFFKQDEIIKVNKKLLSWWAQPR